MLAIMCHGRHVVVLGRAGMALPAVRSASIRPTAHAIHACCRPRTYEVHPACCTAFADSPIPGAIRQDENASCVRGEGMLPSAPIDSR